MTTKGKMTSQHAEVGMYMIDYLGQIFENVDGAEDLNTCAMLGRAVYAAMSRGSSYIRPDLTFDEIFDYSRSTEKRAAFAERLKNKKTALFNHGDGGPEPEVIFTFNDPTLRNVMFSAIFINDGKYVSTFFYRQLDGIQNFFAVGAALELNNPGKSNGFKINAFATPKMDWAASTMQAEAQALVRSAYPVMIFLDDALEEDRQNGRYGNGVTYVRTMMPEVPQYLSFGRK